MAISTDHKQKFAGVRVAKRMDSAYSHMHIMVFSLSKMNAFLLAQFLVISKLS